MWRPTGWKNPYLNPHWNDDGEVSGMEADIREEGADDILKSLEPLIRKIAPSSKLVDILYKGEK